MELNFCRDCVQTFAMASGVEHFKCPNCNNKELIAKVFQKIGIYVPQKVTFGGIWNMERSGLENINTKANANTKTKIITKAM